MFQPEDAAVKREVRQLRWASLRWLAAAVLFTLGVLYVCYFVFFVWLRSYPLHHIAMTALQKSGERTYQASCAGEYQPHPAHMHCDLAEVHKNMTVGWMAAKRAILEWWYNGPIPARWDETSLHYHHPSYATSGHGGGGGLVSSLLWGALWWFGLSDSIWWLLERAWVLAGGCLTLVVGSLQLWNHFFKQRRRYQSAKHQETQPRDAAPPVMPWSGATPKDGYRVQTKQRYVTSLEGGKQD